MNALDGEKQHFPITSAQKFLSCIESHLSSNTDSEPNLAFLSLLFGYLEHELTLNRIVSSDIQPLIKTEKVVTDDTSAEERNAFVAPSVIEKFPTLEFEIVQGLYEHFVLLIKANIDKSLDKLTTRSGCATKKLCKCVSDLIWSGLLRSYHKDKPHIQSLFSYFTGQQLDCFGLAFAVIAACQVLKYSDVHLVASGDHAWAVCGEEYQCMVETTWHGNSTEDKRGTSIDIENVSQSWLYHGGKPVVCDRWMEYVALILSLNPSIDGYTDSYELQYIQQKLLLDMYRTGHLDRYPMALATFADMQETFPLEYTQDISVETIHMRAVQTVETIYDGCHVFPYCSQGSFYQRSGQHRDALKSWAKAAQAVSRYNYMKDDEEVYKEMIEIANELLPQSLKSDPTISGDHECYENVVRFYDGICLWEEGSSTPILHSWWARFFTMAIGRFSAEVRESFADSDDADTPKKDTVGRRSSRGLGSPLSLCGFHSPGSSTTDECPNKALDGSAPETKLRLRSWKMKTLKNILTSGKKLNAQAAGLLLTAQSQVDFVRRRPNASEYAVEYGMSGKRPRKSREPVD